MRIRQVRAVELPLLQDIEVAAGRCFRQIGMSEIADDAPPSIESLSRMRDRGRAHVAVDAADRPTAYLLDEPVDRFWHVEQVSVHPDHAGKRIGRALLQHLADRARAANIPALTLTTFSEVVWNAPYYRRLGFTTMEPAELTAGLRAIRATEIELGYDRWPRECMWRKL